MGCVNSKTGTFHVTSDRPTSVSKPISREEYYNRHRGFHALGTTPITQPTAAPKPEDAKTEDEKQVLKVTNVNFNLSQNTRDHHTDMYELTQERTEDGKTIPPYLVIRRGEPFFVTLTFDRAFEPGKDDIRLIFDVGPFPVESKGSRVTLMLSDKDLPRQWGARSVQQQDNTLTVQIYTPPTCAVGKWTFKFDTVLCKGDTNKVFRYTHPDPVYILFNPWCPEDQVYIDDEVSRREYVLNDKGRVYRGTSKQISSKAWNFGQFEDFVLECVLHLLDNSGISWQARGDPIIISRKISALVNSPDDSGILVGNWSGDYAGGTSPLHWVGSVAIIQQYWKTLTPVKFGQCWVFSGVATTVCRAIGLPCRSVTNFASAHDCDGSITIDNHWTPEGSPLEAFNRDSVWNFHVWNEVWMARPDLPSGFGGWQAIDATPQETSDGVYCAGPASVEAIRNGLTHLPYDGSFIFAEVNADRVNWIQKPDGGWHHTMQTHSIGKFISTKSPLSEARQDITGLYKFPENSQQERTAVWRAIKEKGTKPEIYEVSVKDMTFKLIEKEDTIVGEPFDVTIKVQNESNSDRIVKATLTAQVVYYTGVVVCDIKKEAYNVKCPPNAAGEVSMKVSVDEYWSKLVDMCNIKISCMAQVESTNQFHCESDDFRLRKPDLVVKVPAEAKVGQEIEVEASFKNPLNRSLTRCEFTVEGAGVQRLQTFKHATVGPHAEAKITTKLTPNFVGDKEIVVSFDSKELSDINGAAKLKVIEA